GTAFRISPTGTFTLLYSFPFGSFPQAGLVQGTDGNLYGSSYQGPRTTEPGYIFQMTSNGAVTTLFSFKGTNGANPAGSLIQAADGNFYGTTLNGGSGQGGNVYKLLSAPAIA